MNLGKPKYCGNKFKYKGGLYTLQYIVDHFKCAKGMTRNVLYYRHVITGIDIEEALMRKVIKRVPPEKPIEVENNFLWKPTTASNEINKGF